MIKILIVDDEVLARVGLKSMLSWNAIGCEIIGDANNGKEGLRMAQELHPDIIITDIKMPVMDGIEMMRCIKEMNRNTRFIVLSSYDEFHLVKEAMKLGADEYLIKLDITPDIMSKTIVQVSGKIQIQMERNRKKKIMDRHERINREAARKEYIKKLIDKTILIPEDIVESMKYLDIQLDIKHIACLVIQIDEIIDKRKYASGEDRGLLDFCVENISNEIINDFFFAYTAKYQEGIFIAVFSPHESTIKYCREKIQRMGERLITTLNKYVNIHVSIGVCSELQNLNKAFEEATEAVEYRFFTGTGKVIFFDDCSKSQIPVIDLNLASSVNRLKDAFDFFDVTRIRHIFQYIGDVLRRKELNRRQTYDICCHVAYQTVEILGSDGSTLLTQEKGLHENIASLYTLDKMLQWLHFMEERMVEAVELKKQANQNTAMIGMARKYIAEHIYENIKLNHVASFLNLNHCYLSTIFKQSTGESFSEYVARMKMEEAQRILKKGDYKIYEVAEMLGYDNAYYFSRVFKKVTGTSPSEW